MKLNAWLIPIRLEGAYMPTFVGYIKIEDLYFTPAS